MLNLNNDEKIKTFSNKTFGDMTVLDMNNKPYFPAHFISGLLKNDASTVDRVCIFQDDAYAVRHNMWCQTGVKAFNEPILTELPILFIDEDNVRRLISESVYDKKEEFEKWVFEEIIPSFKKN